MVEKSLQPMPLEGAVQGLTTLAAKIRACQACNLAPGRTLAVPGEGDPQALVMFVGEGPGQDEDRQGRPFVGRSGKFLEAQLAGIGISRRDVFITNVVKCRPPQNRDPLPDELAACDHFLTHQVELINPRIIVTLGRFSMRRWFGDATISRVHGQIRNIGRGRVALAMFHPAAALRNPAWHTEFTRDLAKLPALIERARLANLAAQRGDARPAGVPHPGDPEYDPASEPPAWSRSKLVDDDHTADTPGERHP